MSTLKEYDKLPTDSEHHHRLITSPSDIVGKRDNGRPPSSDYFNLQIITSTEIFGDDKSKQKTTDMYIDKVPPTASEHHQRTIISPGDVIGKRETGGLTMALSDMTVSTSGLQLYNRLWRFEGQTSVPYIYPFSYTLPLKSIGQIYTPQPNRIEPNVLDIIRQIGVKKSGTWTPGGKPIATAPFIMDKIGGNGGNIGLPMAQKPNVIGIFRQTFIQAFERLMTGLEGKHKATASFTKMMNGQKTDNGGPRPNAFVMRQILLKASESQTPILEGENQATASPKENSNFSSDKDGDANISQGLQASSAKQYIKVFKTPFSYFLKG